MTTQLFGCSPHELWCRIQEIEAENAELREQIEEYQWDRKELGPETTR